MPASFLGEAWQLSFTILCNNLRFTDWFINMKSYIHALLWTKRHWQGLYEAWEIAYLKQYLQPTDIVIDVGAHAGSWSIPLSRLVTLGEVIGYEALPYYANTLSKTVRLLRRKNIQVRNKAVSDKPGQLQLVHKSPTGATLTGYTHLIGIDETSTKTVLVDAVSLDDEFATEQRRISFIKCDVEGAELSVFKGSKELIRKHKPVIYTEINEVWCQRYGHHAKTVFDLLASYGYTAYTLDKHGSMVSQLQADSGDFLFMPVN